MKTSIECRSRHELVWAKLEPLTVTTSPYRRPWFGWGLLSDEGLPFDAMSMVLVGRQLREELSTGVPLLSLIPDEHAISVGEDSHIISDRVDRIIREVEAIGDVIDTPVDFVLASELKCLPEYKEALREADKLIEELKEDVSPYTRLGIADDVFMARAGGIKIGWTAVTDIGSKSGRYHEPATDLLAQIVEPKMKAVYTGPGRRMDINRAKAAPYLELMSTVQRFMLTGSDCGHFQDKAQACSGQKGAYRAAVELVKSIVDTFELNIGPLNGCNSLNKAEELVNRVAL